MTMITPSYLGETIEYSSLHACRSTLEDPTAAKQALAIVAASMPGEIPAWALSDLVHGTGEKVADQLQESGLISQSPNEICGLRYRMHSLTRTYAAAQECAPPSRMSEMMSWIQIGLLYRTDYVTSRLPAFPYLPTPARLPPAAAIPDGHELDITWLEIERSNLLAVVARSCGLGEYEAASAIASRLAGYQCMTGAYRDAERAWQAIAAAARDDGNWHAEAQASYYRCAILAESGGHAEEAADLLAVCLPVLEDAGDLSVVALGRALLARCASACGRHAAALRAARHSLRITEGRVDGEKAGCVARMSLGLTYARIGAPQIGAAYCEAALSAARALGEPTYEAAAARAYAQVCVLAGHYAFAERLCTQGIEISRAYGSEMTVARFLVLLGRARQCRHDPDDAVDCLQEAKEIFHRAGSSVEEATAASLLSACGRQRGDYRRAAAYMQDIVKIMEREGAARATARDGLARVASDLAIC